MNISRTLLMNSPFYNMNLNNFLITINLHIQIFQNEFSNIYTALRALIFALFVVSDIATLTEGKNRRHFLIYKSS